MVEGRDALMTASTSFLKPSSQSENVTAPSGPPAAENAKDAFAAWWRTNPTAWSPGRAFLFLVLVGPYSVHMPCHAVESDPGPLSALAQCLNAYQETYLTQWKLGKEDWEQACQAGHTPEQILKKSQTTSKIEGFVQKPLDAFLKQTDIVVKSGNVAQIYGEEQAKPADVQLINNKNKNMLASMKKALSLPGGGDHKAFPIPMQYGKLPPPAPNELRCGDQAIEEDSWYSYLSQKVACLPNGFPYKKAFSHLLELLGPQNYGNYGTAARVGISNRGINDFLSRKTMEDRKFYESVKAFYESIQLREVRRLGSASEVPHAPSLAAEAGRGKFREYEPGWLWQEAIKSANHDPNLAMRLIGFCGHDNVEQARLQTLIPEPEARRFVADQKQSLEQAISELQEELRLSAKANNYYLQELAEKKKAGNPDKDKQISAADIQSLDNKLASQQDSLRFALIGLQDKKNQLRWFLREGMNYHGIQLEFPCYGTHAMELPKSLDARADIPPALKERIASSWTDVKATARGMDGVPSKYYHVYGGALLTCELIGKGMPGWLAARLVVKSAWAYRTLRINHEAAQMGINRDTILRLYHSYRDQALTQGKKPVSEEAFINNLIEEALSADHMSLFVSIGKDSRICLPCMDAFSLMERWGYGGGKIAGIELPLINVPLVWDESHPQDKPVGWSDRRFDLAKKRLKNLLVDWEWTVEQHRAGADFARKVCRKEQSSPDSMGGP